MSHIQLLEQLINFEIPINIFNKDIKQYDDTRDDVWVMITLRHVYTALKSCIDHNIDPNEIIGWAKALKYRSDIMWEQSQRKVIGRILHQLCNVDKSDMTPKERVRFILCELIIDIVTARVKLH